MTRYLRMSKAALNTPSRILFQIDEDGNDSENTTLLLVKQVLFGSKRLDTKSTVPVKSSHSKTYQSSGTMKLII